MATEWFYTRNGKRHGPLSSRKIRSLARRGDLQPSDLLWKEGMTEWRPAGESPKLFAAPKENRKRRARRVEPAAPALDDQADAHDIGLLARLPLGDRPLLAAILTGMAAGLVAVGMATGVLIGIDRMKFLDQAHEGAEAPAIVRVRLADDATDPDAPLAAAEKDTAAQGDAGVHDPAATADAATPGRDESDSGRGSIVPKADGRLVADGADRGRLAVTMTETVQPPDPSATVITKTDEGTAGEAGQEIAPAVPRDDNDF